MGETATAAKPAISAKTPPHAPPPIVSPASAVLSVATPAAALKDGLSKTMAHAQTMLAINQSNFEAIMKSTQTFSRGMLEISKEIVSEAQFYGEEAVAMLKTQAGAKSVHHAVEVQTDLVWSLIKKALENAKKRFELSVRLSEQTMAPIKERMLSAAKF